ncbi:MAG: hypothetical protein ACRD1Y_14820 [Terriglobales bacterium]
MHRTGVAAAFLVALTLSVAGQQRGPSAASGNTGWVRMLYLQARQAVGALPSLLAPGALCAVAIDEMQPSGRNTAAREDLASAFRMALALTAEDGDPAMASSIWAVKTGVEEEVISALTQQHQLDEAFQLVRLADIPKAPLYSRLILARIQAHAQAQHSLPQQALPTAAELVAECERSAHAFPYRGATALLRLKQPQEFSRLLLVRDGYQWAARETDPSRIASAAVFLRAGHRAAPALDSDLEPLILNLIARLPPSPGAAISSGVREAATALLTILSAVDPEQGARSRAGMEAWLSAAAVGSQTSWNNPILQLSALAGPATETGLAPPDPNRFLKLVADAEQLQGRRPARALAAADEASRMLTPALWATSAQAGARLAAVFQQLGDAGAAVGLLHSALDEADREATLTDLLYLNGSPDGIIPIAEDLNQAGAPVLAVYSEVARLDFQLAATRAEAAPFTLLKPLVLARVALVGRVTQP